jgi:hypothetical protein
MLNVDQEDTPRVVECHRKMIKETCLTQQAYSPMVESFREAGVKRVLCQPCRSRVTCEKYAGTFRLPRPELASAFASLRSNPS